MDQTERECVISIATYCLGLGPGQPKFDKVGIVSRGPNTHQKGWCGDFVNFCFMRAGVRDCALINRYDLCGRWDVGMNLARWYAWADATGSRVPYNSVRRGDVYALKRSDGDHLGIVLSTDGKGGFSSIDGNSFGGVVAMNSRTNGDNVRMYINVDRVQISTVEYSAIASAMFSGFKQLLDKWKAELPENKFGGDGSELLPT